MMTILSSEKSRQAEFTDYFAAVPNLHKAEMAHMNICHFAQEIIDKRLRSCHGLIYTSCLSFSPLTHVFLRVNRHTGQPGAGHICLR